MLNAGATGLLQTPPAIPSPPFHSTAPQGRLSGTFFLILAPSSLPRRGGYVPMSSPQFLVIGGPDKDRIFPVHPGLNQMGRHQDATYKLNDPRVSRFHCQITAEGDKVGIKDHRGPSGGVLLKHATTGRRRTTRGD